MTTGLTRDQRATLAAATFIQVAEDYAKDTDGFRDKLRADPRGTITTLKNELQADMLSPMPDTGFIWSDAAEIQREAAGLRYDMTREALPNAGILRMGAPLLRDLPEAQKYTLTSTEVEIAYRALKEHKPSWTQKQLDEIRQRAEQSEHGAVRL